MKSIAILKFLLLSQIISGTFATATGENQVEEVSSGIEQDLVTIISTALKYVSSDNHQNICSKYVPPNNKLTEPSFKWDNIAPKYKGCFKDNLERMYETMHILRYTCSVKGCIDLCQTEGFLYAGLQYSEECYCGNEFPSSASHPKINDEECQMECSGNEEIKKCGGRWAMSLYETGNQIQVIDREGNKVDRNSLDSLEKYTKYTVTVYAEKTEDQQGISEKVEEDRNDWSKQFLIYESPKIDENEESQPKSSEKVEDTQEADEEDNLPSRYFDIFWNSPRIDESIESQPKTVEKEEVGGFDDLFISQTTIEVKEQVPINEDSIEPGDDDYVFIEKLQLYDDDSSDF